MKKILGLLLAMILAIGMCGCSSGTSSVKEYNIDEFLPTYRKILSSIEDNTGVKTSFSLPNILNLLKRKQSLVDFL